MARRNKPGAGEGRASGRRPGEIRIIGGEWRGRKLAVADHPGLRPTTDRVRETLFNWLQLEISGARCLDLFSGAGALGIEAASRGAALVQMIELDPAVSQHLQSRIDVLGSRRLQLHQGNALDWLKTRSGSEPPFDIAFVDPPFGSDLLTTSCVELEQSGCLADQALIYLERRSGKFLELPANWSIIRDKQAGEVAYALAKRVSL